MDKRALITGITGQDGSYLAELLLGKGYEVHGIVRRPELGAGEHLHAVEGRLILHRGDLLDGDSILAAVRASEPAEVYNLAAMSHVQSSWGEGTLSADGNAVGVIRVLEAIREASPGARVFQASSSEMFPASGGIPQDEQTPIDPRSPYGAAKAYGHFLTKAYRERYGLFACSGILFNHESPRRGLEFVTRKVSAAVAAIKLGAANELAIGNLEARRDWGYAPEFVEAMWLMLQRDQPEDFVLGTGKAHSVRDFVTSACREAGIDEERYLRVDPAALRWRDSGYALADPRKAHELLAWQPKVDFEQLVKIMVAADLERLQSATA